jgi:DNA-binding NarL/FixJ family response regulator
VTPGCTALRILLVEDEPDAREALARALRRGGHEVLEAGSVEGARSALDALPGALGVDVAVLDLVLGEDERGGLAVLEALRASGSRGARAPVVVITAFADVARVKAALNLGASHLLEKPFRAADLLALVERLAAAAKPDLGDLVAQAFARAGLTPREEEVTRLALKGLPSPEIASVLGMSEKTVRQHLSKVYEKLGVSSRGELFHLLFPV